MNMPMTIKTRSNCKESKPNAITRICYRGSSTQLYVPAFPRRILTTSLTQRSQLQWSTQLLQFQHNWILSSQKTTNSLFQISLPLQRSLENIEKEWSSCVSEERNSNSESISRTLLKMSEKYQHKNQETCSFEFSKLWIFLLKIVVVKNLSQAPLFIGEG